MHGSRDDLVRTIRGPIGGVGALIGAADKHGAISWERVLNSLQER